MVIFTGEHKVISTSISVKPELALFNGNGHTSRSVSEPISTSFVYLLDIYFKKKFGVYFMFSLYC